MKKSVLLLSFILFAAIGFVQTPNYNPYFPQGLNSKDWKFAAHTFYDIHNNSNYLSNEFSFALNNSEFIDESMKERQIDQLKGSVLAGRTSKVELGVWYRNSNKENNLFYYVGLDAQQNLVAEVDPNLIKLVLNGNKPYAGTPLIIENTNYKNIYFNRIKLGLGKSLATNETTHTLSAIFGVTDGQNLDEINIESASVFTEQNGDFLELNVVAETQRGNTAWGNLFTINGLGASVDLHYSILKDKDFYFAVNINNIGFINWNKSTFSANVDTSFSFTGIQNDTNNLDEIPNDFSTDNLRDIVFENPNTSSFLQALPYDINLNAGKFIKEGKFYIGMNTHLYPSAIFNYRAEFFATWNMKNRFQLSPIIAYSSFAKLNVGLAIGFELWETFQIRAGTSYLNSMFISDSPVGQGGFISLVFINK